MAQQAMPQAWPPRPGGAWQRPHMVPQRLVMPAPQHASASPDAQPRSESVGQPPFPENWDSVDDDMGARRSDVPLPQTPATPGAQEQPSAAPQPQRLFQTPLLAGWHHRRCFPSIR